MNAFEAHETTIGAALRDARETANLTIQRFSQLSGIPEKTVLTLEQDRFQDFPSDPYVRGFLKKYANVCGVSYEHLESLWQSMRQARRSGQSDALPHNRFRAPSTLPWKLLSVHPLAVVAALVFAYIAFQAVYLALPVRIKVQALPMVAQTPVQLRGSVWGFVRSLTVNGDPVDLHGGSFSYALALHGGPNVVELEASNFFRRVSRTQVIVVYQTPTPVLSPSPKTSTGHAYPSPTESPVFESTPSPVASTTQNVY